MKKVCILFFLMALCLASNAVVVQKVILKDGSVLNGYIEKQTLDGKYTVHTDNAVICIHGGKAMVSGEMAYGEKDLDKAWVEWAEENGEFQDAKGNRTLMLGNVIVGGSTVASRVRILESGEVVKYLEMTPSSYTINWKDVKAIRGDKRPKLTLSGINRIYMVKNGQNYEGQFAEETDSTLSLFLTTGGMRTFKLSDVVKYTFVPVNPGQSIFEQSPVVDIIKLKNNASFRGVIIEQNYSSADNKENYVLLQEQSGAIHSIKMSEIAEFCKEENKDYRVLTDVLLKEGELVVNRQSVTYVGVKEMGEKLVLDSIAPTPVIKAVNGESRFVIECNFAPGQSIGMYQLVKVNKMVVKKKTLYYFTYKDLVNADVRPQDETKSVNNTTKTEYVVRKEGIYALYNAKEKKAVTIAVKNK